MKSKVFVFLIAMVFIFLHSPMGGACTPRTHVVEPVTGIAFPSEVRFSQDTADYALQLTGVAARTKWFFKVYALAHYIQASQGTGPLDLQRILTDGPAKQLTIQYAREVPASKITKVLREDFELNTTPSEYREIEASVEQMLAYFVRPVKKGDVFVMRWLSGGRVYLELNGQKLGDTKSGLFARTLWSIWFGKHSVVDPADLMDEADGKEGA